MSEVQQSQTPQWTGRARGGRFGNRFFALLVKRARWMTPWFLFWVSLYFLVAAPAARRVSFQLARRVGRGRWFWSRLVFAYRHFFTFGNLLLDRIEILGGRAERYRFEFDGEDHIREALALGRGVILVTGHLGNWEAMGHLLTRLQAPVCLIMYDGVQPALKATMEKLAAGRSFRVIYSDGSPNTAAAVLAALRSGAIVGMMGDRTLRGEGVAVELLGGTAEFPTAPYVLAAAAGAPLMHVFALRAGSRSYRFVGFPAQQLSYASRRDKQRDLQRWAGEFAQRLEQKTRDLPWQWGNFFPIWHQESR